MAKVRQGPCLNNRHNALSGGKRSAALEGENGMNLYRAPPAAALPPAAVHPFRIWFQKSPWFRISFFLDYDTRSNTAKDPFVRSLPSIAKGTPFAPKQKSRQNRISPARRRQHDFHNYRITRCNHLSPTSPTGGVAAHDTAEFRKPWPRAALIASPIGVEAQSVP